MTALASIIVPTYNKLSRLRFVLDAYAFQRNVDFEIVVCDDGSTDGTCTYLETLSTPYPLRLVFGTHRGAGAARNAAVAAATGEVLIFNDDDMVPSPEFVSAHMGALEVADVLSRGPRWALPIEDVPAFLDRGATAEAYAELWPLARLSAAEEWTFYSLLNTPSHPYRFLQSCTSNLAVRRESFARIGGFDEIFGTGWGAEDTEFGYRAQLNGIPIKLCEPALNLHLEHSINSGKKFENGLHNFRIFKTMYPANREVRALYSYVEHAITSGNAKELFDEQTFVDRKPPIIETMKAATT